MAFFAHRPLQSRRLTRCLFILTRSGKNLQMLSLRQSMSAEFLFYLILFPLGAILAISHTSNSTEVPPDRTQGAIGL
jgi:hypothetical protein